MAVRLAVLDTARHDLLSGVMCLRLLPRKSLQFLPLWLIYKILQQGLRESAEVILAQGVGQTFAERISKQASSIMHRLDHSGA